MYFFFPSDYPAFQESLIEDIPLYSLLSMSQINCPEMWEFNFGLLSIFFLLKFVRFFFGGEEIWTTPRNVQEFIPGSVLRLLIGSGEDIGCRDSNLGPSYVSCIQSKCPNTVLILQPLNYVFILFFLFILFFNFYFIYFNSTLFD